MAARELTEKEKKRQDLVEKIIQEKESEGYKRVDLTTSAKKANVMALLLGLPICIIFWIIYNLMYEYDFNFISKLPIMIIGLIVLVVIHELIHGLTWGICAKNHFKSIEFGFIVKSCMPYCTCLEPLSKGQYILGSIMPGLILGIIPLVLSLVTGSFMMSLAGGAMTLGAGGDLTVILNLLKYKSVKKDITYLDHPTEVGLIVLEK